MNLGWTLIHIILNCYDAAFYVMNLNNQLKPRQWYLPYYKHYAFVAVSILFNIINFTTKFSLISMYLFPLIIMVYALSFFRNNWYHKAFWTIFLYTIIVICDFIGTALIMVLKEIPMVQIFHDGSIRLQTISLCRILSTFAWIYLCRRRGNYEKTNSKTLKLMMISSFFMSLLAAILLIGGTTDDFNDYGKTTLPLVVGLMSISFFSFFVISNISDQRRRSVIRARELRIKQRHNNLTEKYQKEIINAYNSVRQFRLDIINYLRSSWPTMNSQNNGNVNDFITAIDSAGSSSLSKLLHSDLSTRNSHVDIVIAIKESEAFHKGIFIELFGEINEIHSVTSEDLCLVLDFLLTEAIENVDRITTEEESIKTISIIFTKSNNGVQLKLQYPVGDYVVMEAMKYVGNITNKYNTELIYACEDMFCEVNVLFPHPNIISQKIDIKKGGDRNEENDS